VGDAPVSLKEVWTTLDGRRFLYRTNSPAAMPPADAPTMVHVHGFAISGRYLMPTAWRLAPDFRTLVPDLPGFGRRERPSKPFDIPALAAALARFLDHVRVDRATLLGNSLGCPIIGEFVAQFPDRVDRAIFVGPAGGEYNLPIRRGIVQLTLAALREPFAMAPIAGEDYVRYGPVASIDLMKSMLRYPTARRLAGMRMPVLAVIGSRDPLISETWLLDKATTVPHVTAVVIEGAAHAINFSHPDQLANVVRSWMAGRPITDDPTARGRVRVILTADA
jgi:pimeloyl-ACP methyl ester carboxylesterase